MDFLEIRSIGNSSLSGGKRVAARDSSRLEGGSSPTAIAQISSESIGCVSVVRGASSRLAAREGTTVFVDGVC